MAQILTLAAGGDNNTMADFESYLSHLGHGPITVKSWGLTQASKISRYMATKPMSSWHLPPGSKPASLERATKSTTAQLM
eukprot:10384368-Ditylum_brightwellii.AAC.1